MSRPQYLLPAALSVPWVILWWVFVSDTPETNRWIGERERAYLAVHTRAQKSESDGPPPRVNWLRLCLNGPVLALLLCNTASCWINYTLMTELPSYLLERGFDLDAAGIWSDLPQAAPLVLSIPTAVVADWCIKRSVPTLTVRRVANAVGLAGAGACMIGICYIEQTKIKLCFLGAALGLGSAGAGSGSMSNLFDIAPSLAGHVKQ